MATKPSTNLPNKARVGLGKDNTPECDRPTAERKHRLMKPKVFTDKRIIIHGRDTVMTLAHSTSRKLFNYLRHWRDEEAQQILCELFRTSGWSPKQLSCTWPHKRTASALKSDGSIPINQIKIIPVEQWILQRSTGLMLADCELGTRGVYPWLSYDPNAHKHLLKKGMIELAWTKENTLVVVPSVSGALTMLDLLEEGFFFIHQKKNQIGRDKAKELRRKHDKPKVKSVAERRAERINARLSKLGDIAARQAE